MAKRLRLRPQAVRDVEDIAQWTVEAWSPEQAQRYTEGLKERIQSLLALPAQGLVVDGRIQVRRAIYERHLIFYRMIAGGIEIGRILHESRDIARELERYRAWASKQL